MLSSDLLSSDIALKPLRGKGGRTDATVLSGSARSTFVELEAENTSTIAAKSLLRDGEASPWSTTTTTRDTTPRTAQSEELERELLLTLVNDLRSQSKRDQHRISAMKSRIEELAAAKVGADKVNTLTLLQPPPYRPY